MAEIVGLVTAIGAIITSGFQIATAISTIVDGLGTAGAQVQKIAVETKMMLLVLRRLNKHLTKAKRVATEVANIVSDIVSLCRRDIDDIKECVAPLLRKGAEDMLPKDKLRWLFAKSKVSTRQASLDSLKLTLGLFMQALDLMEEDYIEDYMQTQVQQMISESQNIKKTFIEAERRDQAFEKAYEPSQSFSSPKLIDRPETERLSLITCNTTETVDKIDCDNLNNKTLVKALHVHPADGSSDEGGSECLPSHRSLRDDTNSTINLVDDISDEHFMVIADHMRLQKTVSRFALVVIHQRQDMGPDDATFVSTGGETPSLVQSEENYSAAASGASQQRGSGAEPATEATENTGASTSPPDSPLGPRTTFDPSDNAQEPPTTPYGTTGRRQQSAGTYRDPRYPEYQAPGYPPPHFDPGHGNMNKPQFGFYPPFPRSSSYPFEFQPPMHDTERLKMLEEMQMLRIELAKSEEEKKVREERERRQEIEYKMRKDAEDVIASRMMEVRKAQEDAKKEIESAKAEAEKAAREAIEAERKAEEQRQKLHQEAMSRAESEARQKYEEELRAQAEAKMAQQKYEEELIRAATQAKRQGSFLKLFGRK